MMRMNVKDDDETNDTVPTNESMESSSTNTNTTFQPIYLSTRFFYSLQQRRNKYAKSTKTIMITTSLGFWALLNVTCATYVLSPIRDAIALQVGVQYIPNLTLASSVLAFFSSVPIGWLFEAPNPMRRHTLWKRFGITRGETQGTSLALFYRVFSGVLVFYSVLYTSSTVLQPSDDYGGSNDSSSSSNNNTMTTMIGQYLYIAFFLIIHLMKLHSLSLVWGVTTEAMEYEEVTLLKEEQQNQSQHSLPKQTKLERFSYIGFGGTIGGILGSVLASTLAKVLHLSGLLLFSAILLEISAQLSIELGSIMQYHWEKQQSATNPNAATTDNNNASIDTSIIKRSSSFGSMKRVASGNSLRLSSTRSMNDLTSVNNSNAASKQTTPPIETTNPTGEADDNTFTQRLLRGITTILQSRLLMSIFTYNALYASTTTLLSFQRAELIANFIPKDIHTNTSFLAKINIASSITIFAMQASGMNTIITNIFGSQGSLLLIPYVRLFGVISLSVWHKVSNGTSPNLLLFLLLDEITKVINLAVTKPVRESLWIGLSNEARYEAKPIVDTLANRWGGGSAAFLVAMIHRIVLYVDEGGGKASDASSSLSFQDNSIFFGLPPVLFLCLIVASWWVMVSVDLGRIRKRIDLELKKRQ